MSERFLGAWQVREYVYDGDGCLVGTVRQRRELTELANDRLRVWQSCAPDAALAAHPMAAFAGEWVFELSRHGRHRRYHGPAVLGTGLGWGDGVMTGAGVWPDFGYNFRSYALLATPTRQLTGGRFFRGTGLMADIVGVAERLSDTDSAAAFPVFSGPERPETVATNWRGLYRVISPAGDMIAESECRRHYEADGSWQASLTQPEPSQLAVVRSPSNRLTVTTPAAQLSGVARQNGWQWVAELVDSAGRRLVMQEILDGAGPHLVSLRRWYQDEALYRVETLHLQPQRKERE